MDKIITFGISENFIQRLADTILEQCRQEGIALDKTAVIFGGKRPALFLKKELSRRRGAAYAPCRCFSIDEFTHYLVARDIPVRLISDMDACYLVYTIARDAAADILVKHKEFDQFLSWGRQIVSFIDELDLECVRNEQLIAIEESASIGYETPESINRLLEHITTIRSRYHAELAQRKLFSRGLLSLKALSLTESLPPLEFEKIYLANFYYLHKSQEQIIKRLYDADKAVLVFQKDGASWPAFERLAKTFGQAIEPTGQQATEYDVKLYKGFDGHSQVGLVRHILEQEIPAAQREKSVIVLSEPQNLIPLVTQISASVKDFNVSLGYPLERSSLFSLFRYMFQAQATRKGAAYYAKDYLQVLLHPLIKNLRVCAADAAPTRILCHKIEEMLLGMYENPLAGSLFVNLDDIEGQEALYVLTAASAASVDARVEITRLRQALQQIHQVWLRAWEDVGTFAELAVRLGVVCEILLSQSSLASYALNVLMLERIYEIKDELEGAYFKDERFQQQALFKILLDKLRNEVVNFSGSPLKGLQILGLLETRALTF